MTKSIYEPMHITDNFNVIKMWKKGKNARNHHSTLMSIDGELMSMHRKIGHRTEAGVCVVADIKDNINAQTLAHVQLAKRSADTVFHQLVSECSPLFRDEVPF